MSSVFSSVNNAENSGVKSIMFNGFVRPSVKRFVGLSGLIFPICSVNSVVVCDVFLCEYITVEYGGKLTNQKIKFDFGSWLTPKSKLIKLGLNFKKISTSGYIDIQMLWQLFNQPLCLTIGAGTQKTAHSSNEFVEIEKLEKLPTILFNTIQNI